jgi:quercetin dioxygenase-like cupin family protein
MVALIGMAVVACGGTTTSTSTPDLTASARLFSFDELTAGTLGSLPTGSQFARVVEFPNQSPGQTTKSKKHVAGIIYVDTGEQLLRYIGSGAYTVDISHGMAVYLRSVLHTHTTVGPTNTTWYFMALYPSSQRLDPLVTGAQIAYESMDISSSTLPSGSYRETLRRVTIQTEGRSAARRFGGLEVVFVLKGTLALKVAGNSPVQLNAGEGQYVAPGTVTQELAAGSSEVVYLAFFVTPPVPFETDVTSAPSG